MLNSDYTSLARMSEIKNNTLGLYGDVEHLKCDRSMTLGFNGLKYIRKI